MSRENPFAANDEIPFKEKLVKSSLNSPVLKEFENRKDKIIRTVDVEELRSNLGNLDYEELLGELKASLTSFIESYGCELPNPQWIVGKNEKDEEVIYGITDKIEGSDLIALAKKDPKKAVELIENHFQSVVKYLSLVQKNGDMYLSDINKPNQFVYGKGSGDQENKMYLVDVDPRLAMYDSRNPSNPDNKDFYDDIEELIEELIKTEVIFGFQLEKSRSAIKVFIEEKIPKEPGHRFDRRDSIRWVTLPNRKIKAKK